MSFQPSDYLSNLNLVFDTDVSPVDEASHNANLDYFSQAEFFDLDVFSNDFAAREKQNAAMQTLSQQLPIAPKPASGDHVTVKQESSDLPAAAPTGENATSSPSSSDESVNGSKDTSEIKRRRNTAASARFRVKKKLKEKQMEQQAQDLQDRLGQLEKKLRTLEMENKCLRQLIVEKTEKKNCDLLESIKKRSLGMNSTPSAFTYTN